MKNLYSLFLLLVFITTGAINFAQTSVTINGSLVQAKPGNNNTLVATIQPVGHYNGVVYKINRTTLTVLDSIALPNPNYTSSIPAPGSPTYDGILADKITADSVLYYSSYGANASFHYVSRLYRDNNSNHILSIYRNQFTKLVDRNGSVYGLIEVGSPTIIGTGPEGSGGVSAVTGLSGVNTSAIIIADSTANINSVTTGRKYIAYRDANFWVTDISFLKNGNLLLKAISTTLNQTRFIELDGNNPTIGTTQNPNIIRDTTINGPADMLELPNGHWAIVSNNGAIITFGPTQYAALNILDSNWSLIEKGCQFAGRLSSAELGKTILHAFDGYIFNSYSSRLFSESGNIFEHQKYLGLTISGENKIRYEYGNYTDSVVFRRQSFLPDSTLILKVKDTDPTITGAYNYVERYNGTDSLIPTTENISYLKFANASTYTSIGVGNWIHPSILTKWLDTSANQLYYHGWYLGYDSLTNEYYTYAHTVKDTETFSMFTHKKLVKLVLTTDPVDTAVVFVPIPNTAPWHTLSSTVFEDTLTLNKSHFVGGATDADGDTVYYHATGLPAGKVIDSVTGIISGVPTVAPGSYPITVFANDHKGGNTPKNHTIRVSNRSYAGINEHEQKVLSIFPNPASDLVTIENVLVNTFSVYNAEGKLVAKGTSNKIVVSGLPAGIYQLVVVTKNESRVVRKLVVE